MSPTDMPKVASEPPETGEGDLPVLGELIYEYTPNVIEIVEYGASADAVLMRTSAPPKQGARLDLYLEGPVVAGKLKGTFRGVDYLTSAPTAASSCTSMGRSHSRTGRRSPWRPAAWASQRELHRSASSASTCNSPATILSSRG